MGENIKGIDVSEPGFITIQRSSGPPIRYPVSDLLQATDIPTGLTHEQVIGLTIIANVLAVLIRTLIARDILDESFADSAGLSSDLDQLIYILEQLGGAYHEPDFGNVEDA